MSETTYEATMGSVPTRLETIKVKGRLAKLGAAMSGLVEVVLWTLADAPMDLDRLRLTLNDMIGNGMESPEDVLDHMHTLGLVATRDGNAIMTVLGEAVLPEQWFVFVDDTGLGRARLVRNTLEPIEECQLSFPTSLQAREAAREAQSKLCGRDDYQPKNGLGRCRVSSGSNLRADWRVSMSYASTCPECGWLGCEADTFRFVGEDGDLVPGYCPTCGSDVGMCTEYDRLHDLTTRKMVDEVMLEAFADELHGVWKDGQMSSATRKRVEDVMIGLMRMCGACNKFTYHPADENHRA